MPDLLRNSIFNLLRKVTCQFVIAKEVKQSVHFQKIASVTSLLRNDVWTFRSRLNFDLIIPDRVDKLRTITFTLIISYYCKFFFIEQPE